MTEHDTFVDDLMRRSDQIVAELRVDEFIGRYVDDRPLPRPFVGAGPIRLVVVDLDASSCDERRRDRSAAVLNLDRKSHMLCGFVERICQPLGLALKENVYATNACKNFFAPRPNAIKRRDKVDVITRSWERWRELLLLELARFPDAIVCTLGQPILRLLLKPGQPRNLGHYWGMTEYYRQHQSRRFRFVEAEASSIGRRFVPLYHLYSTGVQYFRTFRHDYLLSVIRGQWSVAGRSGEWDG